jgi:hypothetical protein
MEIFICIVGLITIVIFLNLGLKYRKQEDE